jgi:hypothetical protein
MDMLRIAKLQNTHIKLLIFQISYTQKCFSTTIALRKNRFSQLTLQTSFHFEPFFHYSAPMETSDIDNYLTKTDFDRVANNWTLTEV